MKIGIVGATGEVGLMMIKCLEEFEVLVSELKLFCSARSAGKKITFNNQTYISEELTEDSMKEQFDYLLFSAGSKVSKKFAPIAAEAGNTVIDNSSAFRRNENIPLIVPEINGDSLKDYKGIISNPNCSTIQLVLALKPMDDNYNLKKVLVTTFQSVSGAGHKGIMTLEEQRLGSYENGEFPRHIDFNVIPQIGEINEDGYCDEEEKIHYEARRILSKPDMEICATVTRVPVLYGHSESVFAEFEKPIEIYKLCSILKKAPAVKYSEKYMTPYELKNSNDSHVSRVRHAYNENSIQFWNVANNVRLGAATNAVKIMLHLIDLNA
jgi:aspartate-semialdehyde dehydrogenase